MFFVILSVTKNPGILHFGNFVQNDKKRLRLILKCSSFRRMRLIVKIER
jgi:hypothetical protein